MGAERQPFAREYASAKGMKGHCTSVGTTIPISWPGDLAQRSAQTASKSVVISSPKPTGPGTLWGFGQGFLGGIFLDRAASGAWQRGDRTSTAPPGSGILGLTQSAFPCPHAVR